MIKDNDIIQNTYEHIRKAIIEAQNRYIEANTIILNKNFAISNELYVPITENSYAFCPPILFGLKVKYAEKLPLNANFALMKSNEKSEYERLVEENKKLKKAIEILKSNLFIDFKDIGDYYCIYFKHNKYDECDYTILCIEDKKQYELLKEVLGND